MRPVICMISDGGVAAGRGEHALVECVGAAARAGVDLIQIRERGLDDGVLAALVRRCVSAVQRTRARVVVNDRLDVALASGAHGVHLRSDSYAGARARAITGTGFLVGRSVHTVDDVIRAVEGDSLDYLIFGTVFVTASKPGQAPAGLAALAEAARATPVPVLAIGGVTAGNAAQAARTGASGVAAMGLFASGGPQSFPLIVDLVTRAFDTPERGS